MTQQKYDLHCDGTSRGKDKFVGQQVTLADHTTLSLGFHVVALEDSRSLLDITVNMLEELSNIGDGDTSLHQLFKNMVGIMTDRAATMKCFQEEVQKARREILQSPEGLHRLYCNAHFLLGLSTSASKALHSVESTNDWARKLGRDNLPVFRGFAAKEPAAVRLVRLTCDILGPRGDDKNGCSSDWTAYCAAEGIRSMLTSFRSNRFNNLFEAAAAIIHHRHHIVDFFANWKEPTNLKQRSVMADLESSKVIVMVSVLATIFMFVSGPFWRLVKSDTHYLDQSIHIQQMFGNMMAARDHNTVQDLLVNTPALPRFALPNSPVLEEVLNYIGSLSADDASTHKAAFTIMLDEFIAVTKRQLADFLQGGVYSNPVDIARTDMAHCQLNNLFGEACLGDLDFSLFKRRHSTVHHHATINMKRNRPISRFLQQKSSEQQHKLIQTARRNGPAVCRCHVQREKAVLADRQEYLRKQQQLKEMRSARKEANKLKIIRDVQASGGLCLNREDVRKQPGNKVLLLKHQLQYHRQVLGASDQLLCSSRLKLQRMTDNLCLYLEKVAGTLLPLPTGPTQPATSATQPQVLTRPARIKQTKQASSDSESEQEEDEDEFSAEQEAEVLKMWESGKYSQGQTVAVYYDDCFYVGEVLGVKEGGDCADITFMEQLCDKNMFRWGREDTDTVDRKFVFVWDVGISSSNGRTWSVSDFTTLKKTFHHYRKLFV